jgi:uncharacterized membrane protein YjjP (DUF1212 family)
VPEGILFRAGGVEKIFRDMQHANDELRRLVNQTHVRAEQQQRLTNQALSAHARGSETQEKKEGTEQKRDLWLVAIQSAGAATALYLLSGGSAADLPYLKLGRFVIFALSSYLAYAALGSRLMGWAWLMGMEALAFNPLVHVGLNLQEWLVLDSVAAIGFVTSIFGITLRHERRSIAASATLSVLILLSFCFVVALIESEFPNTFYPPATEAILP